MDLSKNFTLDELVSSGTAERLGIDNTPTADQIEFLRATVVGILQPVREQFGLTKVSSGFRCEELESAICWGGKYTSSFGNWCKRKGRPINESSWAVYFAGKQHPKGFAVDFEVPGVANIAVARWITEAEILFDQLILEFWKPGIGNAGWVHVSHRGDAPDDDRLEVLTLPSGGGYRKGLPTYDEDDGRG